MNHATRRDRLRAVLAAQEVDALLVTRTVNVRYLTGFSGSAAALLLGVDEHADPLLATDDRYVTQAGSEAPDVPLLVSRGGPAALLEQAAGQGLVRVAFEDHAMTVAELDRLRRDTNGVELVPAGRLTGGGQLVESLREIKDDGEIAVLTEACRITDAALQESLAAGGWVGRTERQLAADLEHRMRLLGADGPAFDTIVGAGPNSAVPHHRPTGRPVQPGDLVVVDFGAQVDGYHADLSRTLVAGRPAGWQQEVFDVVRAAQRAGRRALRAGATCREVDATARQVVVDAGRGASFGHGLGHGVGLEIHEAPMLGPSATGSIAPRTTITVEPGVYLPGHGGVRIEDTLVVAEPSATGAVPAASLTNTGRDLHVLD